MIFGGPVRKQISKDIESELFKKQKGRCNYCGRKMSISYFHVDHKTPVSRDGKESIGNYQLLCAPCNGRKGDLTDGEFRRLYHLTPSRQAKTPPSKVIPQSYFIKISKEIAAKKAKKRRTQDSWSLF